jgi:hypothetical protein
VSCPIQVSPRLHSKLTVSLLLTQFGSRSVGCLPGGDIQLLPPFPTVRFARRSAQNGSIDSSSIKEVARRVEFPLRNGQTKSGLVLEGCESRFIADLTGARRYLEENVEEIFRRHSRHHPTLARDHIILVIGSLTAVDWAVMVSHGPTG